MPDGLYERQCRFESTVVPFRLAPRTRRWLAKGFGAESVRQIWGEGVARVDPRGFPTEILDDAWPRAVQTNKAVYLAVELLLPDTGEHCGISYPFDNKVFDLAGCPEAPNECSQKAATALFTAIEAEFVKRPIGASRSPIKEAPGELTLERHYKPSLVLGAPYYERRTLARTYNDDGVQEGGGMAQNASLKGAHGKRFIFLRMSHVFTRSANARGIYAEPAPQQTRGYAEEVQAAVARSVVSACKTLGGNMRQNLCAVVSK